MRRRMSRTATASSPSNRRAPVLAAALGLTIPLGIPLGMGAVSAQSTSGPATGATPGSVFSIVEREPSGGNRPISITVNRGVAYVLNAEEFMCTGLGTQPSVTGFAFDSRGALTPIPGSTRPLSGLPPRLHTGGLRQDR